MNLPGLLKNLLSLLKKSSLWRKRKNHLSKQKQQHSKKSKSFLTVDMSTNMDSSIHPDSANMSEVLKTAFTNKS